MKSSEIPPPRRNGGVADFPATKGVRCACEQSPRKRPYKAFFKICHYEKLIEKQSSKRCGFLIVHARVPIPRKGSFRLRLCAIMTNVADIEPLSTSPLGAIPPRRFATPTALYKRLCQTSLLVRLIFTTNKVRP